MTAVANPSPNEIEWLVIVPWQITIVVEIPLKRNKISRKHKNTTMTHTYLTWMSEWWKVIYRLCKDYIYIHTHTETVTLARRGQRWSWELWSKVQLVRICLVVVRSFFRACTLIWKANIDLSFVIDAFTLVLNLLKYVIKSKGEIGPMLSNVQNKASKQDNLFAREAF